MNFNWKQWLWDEDSQMYIRIRQIHRQRRTIFTFLTVIFVVLMLNNVHFLSFLDQRNCSAFFCELDRQSRNVWSLEKVIQKFNIRTLVHNIKFDDDPGQFDSNQICRHPNLDLSHDSVKFAFYPLEPLNCSGSKLFVIKDGVVRIDKDVLKGRKLERCEFFGIERVSDDLYTYTESLKKTDNFDMIVSHDFIRIFCFLEKGDSGLDGDEEERKRTLWGNHTYMGNNTYLGNSTYIGNQTFFGNNTYLGNITYMSNHTYFSINSTNLKSKLGKANWTMGETGKNSDENSDMHDTQLNMEETHYDNDNFYDDMESYYRNYDEFSYLNPLYSMESTADFNQFLVQVNPNPEVLSRISQIKSSVDGTRMNVLIFGMDSLSHMAFQRKLPKTYKLLKRFGSVVLNGYNIVGDATTAALIPILTGKTETELPDVRKSQLDSENVDVYPLIWKEFQKEGYATMFAEDEPGIAVFNLRLNGFKDQPTDHYMRTFWQALGESELRRNSQKFCTGSEPTHMFLLDYAKDFFDKYANVSKFAFMFSSELTHGNNNPGQYMDADLVEFLKTFNKLGHLDNTLVVIMADHGARYREVRKTVQGKLEERLPMMSLLFPPKFQQQYPHLLKNLRKNSNMLTTPFDIHATLRNVLHIKESYIPIKEKDRGISLLKEIPLSRTCAAAGIDMHWCTCMKQLDLDVRDTYVQNSATKLLRYINNMTNFMRSHCVRLKMKKIMFAYLTIPNEKVLKFKRTQDDDQRVANFSQNINLDIAHFQVTIETLPNNGLYEATIQVNMTSNLYLVTKDISRLDLYGSQPSCVQEKYPDLRKYCFCKEYLISGIPSGGRNNSIEIHSHNKISPHKRRKGGDVV